jgi:SAM-dependent methyltransferase
MPPHEVMVKQPQPPEARLDRSAALPLECRICRSSSVRHFCTAFDRAVRTTGESWQILKCGRCGFAWTFPPLPAERIASYYPPAYLGDVSKSVEQYLGGRLQTSRSWRGETKKVRLLERFCPGGGILDVGCGAGQFLWALDPRRWRRVGVELSKETVELVQSRIPDIDWIPGDIYSERLAGGSFDALTFWHALEHLPEPEKVLARAAGLLRSGGWLIVSLPNIGGIQAGLFRKYWYPFDDVPRHLYHFSKLSLDLLLERAGFLVKRHLLFSPLVNFHSLKHSLLNWSEDRCRGRVPYYVLKPLLFLLPPLERLTGRCGILTTIAQKKPAGE